MTTSGATRTNARSAVADEEMLDAERLAPTYRLIKGIPGRSYGLAIARRLAMDAGVLARAEKLVSAGAVAEGVFGRWWGQGGGGGADRRGGLDAL